MMAEEEHAHEHGFVEIFAAENLSAFEQVPHKIITLRLHDRGFSFDLTYEDALALEAALEQIASHIRAST